MSAYIVEIETVQAIVSYAELKERGSFSILGKVYSFQRIGQILLDQNYNSVNERYNVQDRAPKFEKKNFFSEIVYYGGSLKAESDLAVSDIKKVSASDPRFVLGLISNLSYQSCETLDWETCEAKQILDEIKVMCIHQLTNGFPWGFRRESSLELGAIYKRLVRLEKESACV
jgi:hypothetical protein